MSLCFRNVSNKLTTLVNTSEKVTKINHQLAKHVQSTLFLREVYNNCKRTNKRFMKFQFLGEQTAAVTKTDPKERRSGSPENTRLAGHETYIECSEAAIRRYNLKKERLTWFLPRETAGAQQFGFIEYDTPGSTSNNYLLGSNVWTDRLLEQNKFMKYDANTVDKSNVNLFPIDGTMNYSQMPLGKEKEKVVLEGAMPNTIVKSENQDPQRSPDRPSGDHLKAVYDILVVDLPRVFVTPMNYSIYVRDLIYINNIKGVSTKGLIGYMKHISFVRILAHIKFAYVTFDVLQMTVHPEDDTIKVRWRIRGVSGMKIMFKFWKFRIWKLREDLRRHEEWYDGFSTFYVNQDGKVYKHVIDKVIPDQDVYLKEKPIEAKLALFSAVADPELSTFNEILLNAKVPVSCAPSEMANNNFLQNEYTNGDSS